MATGTMKGDNFTVQETPTPSTQLRCGQALGKVFVSSDYITILNAWAKDAGSVVKLGGKIPKGAVPLFGIFEYTGASTATASLGSADDTDALGTITSMTATKRQFLAPAADVANKALDADTEIQLLTAEDGLDSGDIIRLQYFYSMP